METKMVRMRTSIGKTHPMRLPATTLDRPLPVQVPELEIPAVGVVAVLVVRAVLVSSATA